MIYQMMFAIITPALISGAIAERMKFSAYVIFIALWSLIVYAPLAHMVWGVGGFIRELGRSTSPAGPWSTSRRASRRSCWRSCWASGAWSGPKTCAPQPADDLIGTGLLWFGWFGFNAGSARRRGRAGRERVRGDPHRGGVAGLAWILIEWAVLKQPTALGVRDRCGRRPGRRSRRPPASSARWPRSRSGQACRSARTSPSG
jgi:Amt family ammonium transporter